jgi:hypothetical protein
LEPCIRSKWLIAQYRDHDIGHDRTNGVAPEANNNSSALLPGIRDSVRVLLEVRMDRLALKFHETKDLKVRDEIYRLCPELIKLDEPWRFVAI